MRVFEGEALVQANDSDKQVKVKGGHEVDLKATNIKSRGFDKKTYESSDLYNWSSLRSAYLAEANADVAPTYAVTDGWFAPGWFGAGWYWESVVRLLHVPAWSRALLQSVWLGILLTAVRLRLLRWILWPPLLASLRIQPACLGTESRERTSPARQHIPGVESRLSVDLQSSWVSRKLSVSRGF